MELSQLLKGFHENLLSQRQVIGIIKKDISIQDKIIKNTSFLNPLRDKVSLEERIYCTINNIKTPLLCPYCGKIRSFSGRINHGYWQTCGSKECNSKILTKSHTGLTKIIDRRTQEFIRWQNSIKSAEELDDETIKNYIRFNSLADLISNSILINWLQVRFDDSSSLTETVDRIKKNIEVKPKCPVCGRPVNYVGKKSKMFTTYCSNTCAGKSEDTIKKKADSDVAKHGGIRGWTLSNSSKEKIETRKKTMVDRYGTTNPTLIPGVVDKIKQTCRERFGYDNPMQNEEIKSRQIEKANKNRNYGTSRDEIKLKEILEEHFRDLKYHYRKDKRYPFNCDFYIPSKDLFIEFQGSHFHHFRPFDENSVEDLEELERLKKKSLYLKNKRNNNDWNVYDGIIAIWTNRDPRKRQIAKDNHVNLLEVWPDDLKDLDNLIKKIKNCKDIYK